VLTRADVAWAVVVAMLIAATSYYLPRAARVRAQRQSVIPLIEECEACERVIAAQPGAWQYIKDPNGEYFIFYWD